MERINFGGHPKYNHAGAAAGTFSLGRSDRYASNTKATKQRGLSLFDLNPHKSSLGLNLQDFTAEKLCPRPTAADLHSDPVPQAAAATGAALGQQQAAGPDAAAEGAKKPQESTLIAPAASALAGQQQQAKQQQLAAEALGDDGTAEAASADVGCRKRQRTSHDPVDPEPAAAATGHEVAPCSNQADAGAAGSSPGRDGDFIFIDSSSSEYLSADSDADEEHHGPGVTGQNRQQGKQQHSDVIHFIDSDDDEFLSPAAAGGGDGQISKRQRRKQKQQQQQQEEEAGGAGDDASSSSDSGSESDMDISDDGDGTADFTGSGQESETGPGNDGAAGADPNSTREQKQQQRELGYQPPWLPRLAHFSSPMLRLHNEIVAFCQMLAPTAEESASRSASLESLKGVVRGIWPSADVLVFGSYATGLYTPASDTDVVVVGTGSVDAQTGLRALAGALDAQHLVRNMQLVLTARVPIVKFEMIDSGLAFDVSWEVPSGPQGAEVVKQLLQEWPSLKPLALVLKVFLTQRELNEVYTGGVGSYTLIIMIVALLQLHQSRRPAGGKQQQQQQRGGSSSKNKRRRGGGSDDGDAQPLDGNLGLLLVDFMRLYGRVLNLNHVGIACKGQGCYFDRSTVPSFIHNNRRRGGAIIPNHVTLCVEDPIDSTNDTARGSYNMKTVRQVFDHAYQTLTLPCPSNMSPLGRIIHLAPVVSGRPVPPWSVEAPEGRSGGGGRSGGRRSDHDKHERRRNSSGGRERGRGDKKGGSRSNSRSHSRSRSKDRDRGGKKHHHGSSSSKKHRRDSSTDGGKQHKGKHNKQQRRSSSEGGKQQGNGSSKQQQQQQNGGRQQGGSGGNKGGQQGSRGNNSSRQSYGSDGGREYGHRDKRRKY